MVEKKERVKFSTDLTPEQKIIAAYLYFVRDMAQADIAIAMGGLNNGRVNEACKLIGSTVGLTTPGYKESK